MAVFLKKAIAGFFAPDVPLIDGNEGTVRQLGRRLSEEGLLTGRRGGRVTFLSSMEDERTLTQMQNMLMMCTRGA